MMVMGLNQQVGYGGIKFYIETAHHPGSAADRIVSHVFFNGTVITSHTTSHRHHKMAASAQAWRLKLQRQHRDVLRRLSEGKFDRQIRDTPGTGNFKVCASGVAASQPPATASGQSDAHKPARPIQVEQPARANRPPLATRKLILALELCCQARDQLEQGLLDEPDDQRLRDAIDHLQTLVDEISRGVTPPWDR